MDYQEGGCVLRCLASFHRLRGNKIVVSRTRCNSLNSQMPRLFRLLLFTSICSYLHDNLLSLTGERANPPASLVHLMSPSQCSSLSSLSLCDAFLGLLGSNRSFVILLWPVQPGQALEMLSEGKASCCSPQPSAVSCTLRCNELARGVTSCGSTVVPWALVWEPRVQKGRSG